MTRPVLYLGNKNYSSWSLRPWLLLRHLGIDFEERVLPLDTPEFTAAIAKLSPSRRVPLLEHGTLRIWDSLAICEYACELAGRGWPPDAAPRAVARSVSAEMHSGFVALRNEWPMNARAQRRKTPMTPALKADIERIDASWTDCRARFGAAGPWLFGSFSVADAMYAPVALRFATYGARALLSPQSALWLDTMLADAHLGAWVTAAAMESWTIAKSEVGA
jgi:glutathione S-transferase